MDETEVPLENRDTNWIQSTDQHHAAPATSKVATAAAVSGGGAAVVVRPKGRGATAPFSPFVIRVFFLVRFN